MTSASPVSVSPLQLTSGVAALQPSPAMPATTRRTISASFASMNALQSMSPCSAGTASGGVGPGEGVAVGVGVGRDSGACVVAGVGLPVALGPLGEGDGACVGEGASVGVGVIVGTVGAGEAVASAGGSPLARPPKSVVQYHPRPLVGHTPARSQHRGTARSSCSSSPGTPSRGRTRPALAPCPQQVLPFHTR
jgi:hypothetical protein